MDREQLYTHSLSHFLEPIRALLSDDSVSEIMIIGANNVYCERGGCVAACSQTFPDEQWLTALLHNLAEYMDRQLSPSQPMLDARLPQAVCPARVHAVVPPASRSGICITIRLFRRRRFTLGELVAEGTLTAKQQHYLESAVASKRNIVVCGGTGTGKTTLLDALSASIGATERIIVIEDTSELRLHQPHTIYLEAQHVGRDDEPTISIRELFVNALRMRPDRILIGEVRRGEALDLVQAMLSGHAGSLTTVHASSPQAAAIRLETLCLQGEQSLPQVAARLQVATALDVAVQIVRESSGKRRISQIAECEGVDAAGNYMWNVVA